MAKPKIPKPIKEYLEKSENVPIDQISPDQASKEAQSGFDTKGNLVRKGNADIPKIEGEIKGIVMDICSTINEAYKNDEMARKQILKMYKCPDNPAEPPKTQPFQPVPQPIQQATPTPDNIQQLPKPTSILVPIVIGIGTFAIIWIIGSGALGDVRRCIRMNSSSPASCDECTSSWKKTLMNENNYGNCRGVGKGSGQRCILQCK